MDYIWVNFHIFHLFNQICKFSISLSFHHQNFVLTWNFDIFTIYQLIWAYLNISMSKYEICVFGGPNLQIFSNWQNSPYNSSKPPKSCFKCFISLICVKITKTLSNTSNFSYGLYMSEFSHFSSFQPNLQIFHFVIISWPKLCLDMEFWHFDYI